MTIDAVVERIAEGSNLLDNLSLIDINTWQTAREVFAAWQSGASVQGVITANMAIYRLVDGEVVFDLLERQGNSFMDDRFQEETYKGILDNEFFFPADAIKSHISSAITAGQSTTIKYSEFNVKTKDCGANYGYVEVGEKNTDEEKRLFSAVYGVENPGIGKRVYLLREDVVKQQLKNRETDLVARACYFGNGQYFGAYDRDIGNYYSAVRGVRCAEIAEGDAKKSSLLKDAYDSVFNGVSALSDAQVYDLYIALQPRVMGSAQKQMKK